MSTLPPPDDGELTQDSRPGKGSGRPADPFTERTPRVVSASKLHRAAARRRSGRFLAEGVNAVEAALSSATVVELFCTPEASVRFATVVASASTAGVPVSPVTERAARSLSDTVTPTGIVALCRSVVLDDDTATTADHLQSAASANRDRPRLVAIGQALAEPGNVGTLIRVCDALGADAVWLTEGSVDPENPKAVRASAGSLFHIPVTRAIPDRDLIDRAHAVGLQVAVATGDGEADIEDSDEVLARPTAWVFGNEAHGVPADLVTAADVRVRIPIRGRAESLNIVTAASICLHTSARLQGRRAG